jgi:hypothetical protein
LEKNKIGAQEGKKFDLETENATNAQPWAANQINNNNNSNNNVVWWSEFLAADPEVQGSIPSAIKFSKQQCLWNWGHSAL